MKKLGNILESKRSIAGLFILAGLVFTTYKIQENSGQIKRLSNFESGIQTCFTRVNQTYTANLLGDSASSYLTQNFQNLTEECFAEGILTAEQAFQKELPSTARILSNLASNVHWFHEDLLSPAGTKNLAGTGEGRDVGSRFEKIETMKDQILDAANVFKGEITNSLNKLKNIFYVSATLLVILMLAEYMSLTRRRFSNNAREKEAEAELMDNGGVASVKVGEIIRVALEQNELTNCSKLFSNFYTFAVTEKGKKKMSLETLVTPIGSQTTRDLSKNIEQIWEDDSIGMTVDGSNNVQLRDVNLEQASSSVIDLLAEKLFSKGVQVDFNISENLMISAQQEELEQALFHLYAFAVNSTQSQNGENKTISAYAHKLGDVVVFDLHYSGAGFDEAVLKQRIGLGDGVNNELDLDLKIATTLLGESQAKIQLDNKLNQNGHVVGGRIKIIFKGAQPLNTVATGRLVDLKVGSKKEIMASLQNQVSGSL